MSQTIQARYHYRSAEPGGRTAKSFKKVRPTASHLHSEGPVMAVESRGQGRAAPVLLTAGGLAEGGCTRDHGSDEPPWLRATGKRSREGA